MNQRSALRAVMVLGLAAAAGAACRDAAACGEEMAPFAEEQLSGVAWSELVGRTEAALREGRYAAAAGAVIRMFPDVRTAAIGHNALLDRARRTLAVAAARTDGALGLDRELPSSLRARWTAASAKEREANVAWAVGSLRQLDAQHPDDPGLQTDLGEALSRVDGHADEALKLLGGLADKDLLGTPQAYAALARLRARAGDQAGRDAAVKRCEGMTPTASLCQAPAPAGARAQG